MAFQIWTDTSANLPAAMCQKQGIRVLPFHFIHNNGPEECCLDTDSFPYEEYYEDLRTGGMATTSIKNRGFFGPLPSEKRPVFLDFFTNTKLRQKEDILPVLFRPACGSFRSTMLPGIASLRSPLAERKSPRQSCLLFI